MKFNLIILVLVIVFTNFDGFAQPTTVFTQENKGKEGNSNPNDPEAKRKQQEYNEIVEMKEMMMNMEDSRTIEANEKLNVNIDSLYTTHSELKDFQCNNKDLNAVSRIIPHSRREKLVTIDTSLVKYLKPVNNKFSILEIPQDQYSDRIKSNLLLFDQTINGFRFTTMEILQSILPPLIIGNKPLAAGEYKNAMMQVFINYPGLVYYCDKGFLKLIQENKFGTIMLLQKRTINVVDLTKTAKS